MDSDNLHFFYIYMAVSEFFESKIFSQISQNLQRWIFCADVVTGNKCSNFITYLGYFDARY